MINLDDSPHSPYDLHRLEMYDEIYDHESLYRDLDEPDDYFENNQYYIGLSFYDKDFNNLLLASTVQNTTFFKYKLDDVIDYWSTYNSCDTDPLISITDYFDIGVGLEHRTYSKCINNVQVELYKVDIMGHTWPQNQTFGISASDTIWEFINRYDINGRID